MADGSALMTPLDLLEVDRHNGGQIGTSLWRDLVCQ